MSKETEIRMKMEKEKKQEKEQRRQYERGKRRIRTARKTGEFAVQKNSANHRQSFHRGTEEARTPDLSRVRRTLIPAELRSRKALVHNSISDENCKCFLGVDTIGRTYESRLLRSS